MHILGKVFIGLIVVAALGAAYLTIDLSKKREEWMGQIVTLKNQRDKNTEALRKARLERDRVQAAVNRQLDQWGRQWVAPNSQPVETDQGIGVRVGVGTAQGLATAEIAQKKEVLPTIYVFGNADQEQSTYLGNFALGLVDNNAAAGVMTRQPYEGEAQGWPSGVYRVRESIPEGWKQIFIDLHTHQTLSDQQIVDEQAKLEIQDKHIAESQATLNARLAELNGNSMAPEKASDDVKNGLVETIRRDEAQRNTLLKDVDALRRSISDNYAALVDVLEKNREIVDSMAAESSARTAAKP